MRTAFDLIIAPLVTEKSNGMVAEKKYAFKVKPDAGKIENGMLVRIGGKEFTVEDISETPVAVVQGEKFSEYLLHVGNLQAGEWVYEVILDGNLTDGIYSAEIVVDSVSPLSFILN